MMLVTLTCAPPSCSARLPQKFSAATTLISVALPEFVAVVCAFVAHPATAATRSAAAPAAVPRRGKESGGTPRRLRKKYTVSKTAFYIRRRSSPAVFHPPLAHREC